MSLPRFFGRRTPYTTIGISRVPCVRCGEASVHQWQACANGRRYVALCLACDIAVNELVLRFLKVPGWRQLMRWYRRHA
ncbi:MAG: hypothetical protein H0X64_08470 [Gemmatimonadaceae bacterium]|nr:hypothetical protein [Gemmatimonadaceae bacterium]